MPGNYSLIYTESAGNTILASRRNAEHQNHINKMEPQYMDDYSSSVAEMRTTADPGEDASESLATSLQGEIERLRFAILETKQALDGGLNYWYETPTAPTFVTGTSSSTDNAIARFNGTTGAIQNSNITITDLDVLTLADTTITTSSSSTTFSPTTVADGSAWDLSGVRVGDVVSADGSLGTVTVINDGSDTLTVGSWDNGDPANGSVATVLRKAALSVNGTGAHVIGATFANEVVDNYTRPTGTTVAERGVAISSSSGSFDTSSTSYIDVTNLSVTITTTGRPVKIFLQSGSSVSTARIGTSASSTACSSEFKIVRDSTDIAEYQIRALAGGATSVASDTPPGSIVFVDTPAAGTYTYKLQARSPSSSTNTAVYHCKLVAYEL
jgi:hypothetical protein